MHDVPTAIIGEATVLMKSFTLWIFNIRLPSPKYELFAFVEDRHTHTHTQRLRRGIGNMRGFSGLVTGAAGLGTFITSCATLNECRARLQTQLCQSPMFVPRVFESCSSPIQLEESIFNGMLTGKMFNSQSFIFITQAAFPYIIVIINHHRNR